MKDALIAIDLAVHITAGQQHIMTFADFHSPLDTKHVINMACSITNATFSNVEYS